MLNSEIFKQLKVIAGDGNVLQNEAMSKHTSFKVGGNADVLVVPQNVSTLQNILKYLKTTNTKFYIIGNGSNLVVSDKGVRGVVIKLSKNISHYSVSGQTIKAGAGILLSKLSSIATANSLSGLEFASGIPGTLGGGVTMNAGAYKQEMSAIVESTLCLNSDGEFVNLIGQEHDFGYRKSAIQAENLIAVECVLKLKIDDKDCIKAKISEFSKCRSESQPLEMPSAGSVFKRPEGHFAGQLIENSGLKGYTIGGAMVSEKHCGFIVNKGGATAEDIMNLIQYIQRTVKDKFDVDLEREVKYLGE